MVDSHLFEAEMAALDNAKHVLAQPDAEASLYKTALEELTQHYQRLIRETNRLIRHGDRTEAELNAVNAQLKQLGAELDYKARHDTLTGTLNRGAVFEQARCYLHSEPLALILLDIDFFKRINDAFGHPAGDAVIQELVERLVATLAGRGEIGRVGGEEFTVLLPNHSLKDAQAIAEKVRTAIADHAFSCLPHHVITASFGVSWSPPGTHFEHAYSCADQALYRAKHLGRNQVAAIGSECVPLQG